jgi:hypothetical protein
MATATPPSDNRAIPAGKSTPAGSDEPVWVRYSPHGELPLSSVTSFVLHGLVLGLALLAVWATTHLFSHATRTIPIETIRLANPGGGGQRSGTGDAGGTGNADLKETGGAPSEAGSNEPPDKEPERPDLKPPEGTQTKPLDFKDTTPTLQQGDSAQALSNLRTTAASMSSGKTTRPRGPGAAPAKGKGGSGTGGGKGSGHGPGEGRGTEPGKPLTKSEKRMSRWAMHFDTRSGPDYLGQLQALGADLAFPVTPGQNPTYKVVLNGNLLRPPGVLRTVDLAKYKGVRWLDEDPGSVAAVITTLGLRGKVQPTHFVAFMPAHLEEKLAQMEKSYANREEDDIEETHFRIMPGPGGYVPQVMEQKPITNK